MKNFIVNSDVRKGKINRNIYGHFAEHLGRCIYEGFWVEKDSDIPNKNGIRSDVVEALKEIKIPVLRWPGGCFADEYHWKDGIGPYEERPRMVNTHWGQVVENNHFGTHEFFELCEQLGTEPYICGNVGSGTVHEMQQWIEYMTFDGESPLSSLRLKNGREKPWKLDYFGIGNESWGCGGNMQPEYYADVYKRYQTYARNYGSNRLYKIACGPYGADYRWTEVLMQQAGKKMNGLSLHHYTNAKKQGSSKGSATNFEEKDWFSVMKSAQFMEELVTRHSTIMDQYDPEKKVGLIVDEWGTWFDVEPGTNPGFLYQQNTLRDAIIAGVHLNIFNNHCDRIQMANIAQTVNVLQAMILTDGKNMLLTPTYHVFNMFKVHQDADLLDVSLENAEFTFGDETIPQLSASASINADGKIHLSICNMNHMKSETIHLEIRGADCSMIKGKILTSEQMNTHNTFENPQTIKPIELQGLSIHENTVRLNMPSKSVIVLELDSPAW